MRATQVFREVVRVTLTRHRAAAAVSATITAVVGVALVWATPQTWRVEADLHVSEPVSIHRLANPFVAIPSQKEELAKMPELLHSRGNLVAMVKRADLIDHWSSSRPVPMRLVDWARRTLRGPPQESDLLDALVDLVDKRLSVSVNRSHLEIAVQWPSAEGALLLTQAALSIAQQQRETSTIRSIEESAVDLSERLAGKRVEIKSRVERIGMELKRAAVERRFASIEADLGQLLSDRSRAADLEVMLADNSISLDVLRRTNSMRFLVVKPPELPKEPLGPPLWVRGLGILAVVALSGLAGAAILAIAGGQVVSGRQLERAVGIPVLTALPTQWWGSPERSRRQALLLVGGLALASGLALGVSKGNVGLALAPMLGVAALWVLWTVPMKYPLMGLLLLAVTIDDPSDRPYVGYWTSPLYSLGKIFYANVALMTGFEIALIGLGVIMVLRRVLGGRGASLDPLARQAPKVLRITLALSGLSLLALIALGMGTGGQFREALWQFRMLLMLPLAGTLVLHALDFPRDLKPVLAVLIIGSLVKALLGIYFYYAIASPMGVEVAHTTGHADTMVFVVATTVAVLLIWERPLWRHLVYFLLWMPFVGMALKLNDRRVAYVDILMALVAVFLLSPMHRFKRFFVRALVVLSPVLVLYVGAGWNSRGSSVFAPVIKLRSIVAPPEDSEEESSNAERDIENYNILKSWERSMLFGVGFGHAFDEFIPSNDFRQSNYGHVGHNSILWLLWIGGMVGFSLVLFYIPVTTYLIARTLRVASAWPERVALFTALTILMTYLLQAFGDMGMVTTQYNFFVAVAVGIAGRLATKHQVLEPARGSSAETAQLPEAMGVQVSSASG